MALADAVVGARYIAQQITWTDEDGTVVDLTGSTITGYKRLIGGSGAKVALDGTLSLVTAASGIFSWAYGAVDVGVAGQYEVQFIATYGGGLKEKTLKMNWLVHEALDS